MTMYRQNSLFGALFSAFLEILKQNRWKKDSLYVLNHPAVAFLKQVDISA